MKIKELIEKLKEFDPETECYWEDVVDGNHSPLEEIYLSHYGNRSYRENGETIKEEDFGNVLFFTPSKIEQMN